MPIKTNGGQHFALNDATVEFYCEDEERGVNLVSVTGLKFLPRIGETVILPGREEDSKREAYEVVAINHNFCTEMAGELGPSEALLLSVNVTVKKAR
jgi:hypothetical protein